MTIPASRLVNVIPSVLAPAGNPLALNSVMLTTSTRVPIGTVQAFASADDVADFFGPTSIGATLANVYFAGFTGCDTLPDVLYFAQYNQTAVAAYLRSASLSGMTLAQLQALSGVLTIVVNGVSVTSASINLSSATSFSNAAALIQTGLQAGTPSNTHTCSYDAQLGAFVITSSTTGAASTIAFATGSLSAGLKLTSVLGAVLSQGAEEAVQSAFMDAVTESTQNWATFMTTFEPVDEDKLLFAQWVQTTGQRFAYVAWDSNVAVVNGAAPSSFGAQCEAAEMFGIFPIYEPLTDAGNGRKAAFVCGCVGSIDFTQPNGRITFAFRGQAGLSADITNGTDYSNVLANGYNCYAAFATAREQFVNLQPGSTPGAWNWFDAYINQVWLNASLQLALITLMTQVKSMPYNAEGYNLIRSAATDPIQQALTNGVIQPGVTLSNSQRAQVNSAAGVSGAADTLQNAGYYLQVLDAPPEVRVERGSPPITLWYTDGGSIQQIELGSINVQ